MSESVILTEYGPAHVLSPAVTRAGEPGWYVVLRKAECHTWVWLGKFVFKVVAR